MSSAQSVSAINVVVTGAAGQIAYALTFNIARGLMFGSDQPINLRLLDLPQMEQKLRAVAMEVEDTASPLVNGKFVKATLIFHTEYDWPLLLAGDLVQVCRCLR